MCPWGALEQAPGGIPVDGPVQARELDLLILVGTFQLNIFCDLCSRSLPWIEWI